jgi:uncharacterized protein
LNRLQIIESDRMTKLEIAALYAGLNILLLVFLGARVANYRRTNRIAFGYAGNEALERSVRAHGNAAEYIPAGLIGLLFLSLLDPVPALTMHVAGLSLTAGRAVHAYGIIAGVLAGRFGGMILTFLALLTCAGGLLWGAVAPVM